MHFLEYRCGSIPLYHFFIETLAFPVGKSSHPPGKDLPWEMRYPTSPGIYNPESLGLLFLNCAGGRSGTIAHQDKEHKLEFQDDHHLQSTAPTQNALISSL